MYYSFQQLVTHMPQWTAGTHPHTYTTVVDWRCPCKQHISQFQHTAVWLGIGTTTTWLFLEMLGLALHKAQLSSVYETLKGSFRLNLAINYNWSLSRIIIIDLTKSRENTKATSTSAVKQSEKCSSEYKFTVAAEWKRSLFTASCYTVTASCRGLSWPLNSEWRHGHPVGVSWPAIGTRWKFWGWVIALVTVLHTFWALAQILCS